MIGIILAGGRARRMGGADKGLRDIGGRPLIARVVAALRAQCGEVIVNASGDAARFAPFGCPVVPDDLPGQPGPLAGVLAGLDYVAHHHPDAPFAVSVPADTPFLPGDLVARLEDQRIADRAAIVCARSGASTHNVVALWSVSLREDLRRALVNEGIRRAREFIDRHPVAYVTWPAEPVDPFFNVNTPGDLATAERIAAALRDEPV